MKSLFWNKHSEFRLLWIYLPAVALHGIIANLYPPVLEVIWDMVFYKGLAYGLHHITTFDLHHHFPMPPLYPLLISPAFFAGDYLTVELIQSWINPFVYFLGLYPAYYFARRLLDPGKSALVCVLFALYPSAIYTQWSMSENLAVPLVMWIMALAVNLLSGERPRMKDGTWMGIAVACVALTRIFLIVFGATVLLWIFYRTIRRNLNPAPIWMAVSLSATILISVWWIMGYLSYGGKPLVYADFNQQPLPSILSLFGTVFTAHWAGLWIEGGLAFIPLAVVHGTIVLFSRTQKNSPLQETVRLVFCLCLTMTAVVAMYYIKRMGIESWSISLRYIFYTNLAALPIAVSALGELRNTGWKRRIGYLSLIAACAALLGLGIHAPDVWPKLRESHAYFCNAPSLDFIYQIRNQGVSAAVWLFVSISLLLTVCGLFFRRTGFILLCGLLLYLHFSGLDHVHQIRERAVHNLNVPGIHDFCRELENGKWENIQIYCEEYPNAPHLIPNLNYWIQYPAGILPPEAPRPTPPYLLLTPQKHKDGGLVFESGLLKAYMYE